MDKPIPEAALQAARFAYGSSMPDEERMRAALAAAIPHLTAAQQPDHIVDATKMVAQQQGQAAHVQCHECLDCGHVGVNDQSATQGACYNCEWTGPDPVEDRCPGCSSANCMGAACPKCGALYRLIAEADVPQPMQQGGGEVVCPYSGKPCLCRDPRGKCKACTAPPSAPVGATLSNPWTGKPRDYRDVDSDPEGVLCVEPGAPLKAATSVDGLITKEALAQQPSAVDEAGAFDANFLRSVASLCRAAFDLCEPKPQRTPEDPREHYGELCLLELTSIADEIERRLAAENPPAAPSGAVNVVGMPEFDGLMDHIHEYGTTADGVVERANAFARAVLARYAPQQPAAVDGCAERCKRRHPHTKLTLTRDAAPDTGWHWSVTLPDGHLYDVSQGRMTFEQVRADLVERGLTAFDAADTAWRAALAAQPAAVGVAKPCVCSDEEGATCAEQYGPKCLYGPATSEADRVRGAVQKVLDTPHCVGAAKDFGRDELVVSAGRIRAALAAQPGVSDNDR